MPQIKAANYEKLLNATYREPPKIGPWKRIHKTFLTLILSTFLRTKFKNFVRTIFYGIHNNFLEFS